LSFWVSHIAAGWRSALLAGALAIGIACQAQIGDRSRPDPGGGSTTPIDTGSGGAPGLECSAPRAAAVRLRLLSASQYDHTVLDMFQVAGNPAKTFGDKVFEPLDDTRVEQRANAAAEVARQAAATLSRWSPCVPPAAGDAAACEQQIIDKIGSRAYRRPLSDEERTQLKTLFDAGIKEKDFVTGVEWFLTGVLQSPDFTYEIVKPDPGEEPGQVRPLSPYEYASRLAYFVWDSVPDEELLAAAANELADESKRQAQIARLMQDARFMRGVEGFYSRWLNLDGFHEVARDAAGFNEEVVVSLSTSLLMTATQLYSAAAPNIASLFSGETYYLNDALGQFYGVVGSGSAFAPATMSGQTRRGLLTHPALMAKLARPAESFPIGRGLFVLRTLLCQEIPPPDGIVIPELPPIQEGLSTRDRLEAHSKEPLCQACHKMIDPLGFAFESFDEVGRYRTSDHGRPVNTSGKVAMGNDLDGPFASGDELLAKMATSTAIRTCFVEKYLDFSLSRQETDPADLCSIQSIGKSFAASGDLKQLVVSIVSSDAFRMRLAEGVAK
jgi:hypothetical protein